MSGVEPQLPSDVDPDSDVLTLDAETTSDLCLFEPEDRSLFAFCDHCRTDSGRRVLRRRMRSPSSDAAEIRKTQIALSFIDENREAFQKLPSEYVALNTERYLTAGYPVVRQRGAIEFHLAAYAFWRADDQFYTKIVRGEAVTRRYLAALRQLVDALHSGSEGFSDTRAGELQPVLLEMHELLQAPGLAGIDLQADARFYWQKLRIDQTLRSDERDTLLRLIELASEIDALVSLADVNRRHSLVEPELLEGAIRIEATALIHPLLQEAVANDVTLDDSSRLLFLTGPNMAGKTTYLRTLATGLYLAHLGLGVPAQQFRFVPVQQLLTAISLRDDLAAGISYFRAEALRMKAIATAVASAERCIAVLDEPFKGTNVKDAFDATLAVLERLASAGNGRFVVTSHLIEIADALADHANVTFGYFEAAEADSRLSFDFVLRDGVSNQRLGMRVLSEEGVFDLLDGN